MNFVLTGEYRVYLTHVNCCAHPDNPAPPKESNKQTECDCGFHITNLTCTHVLEMVFSVLSRTDFGALPTSELHLTNTTSLNLATVHYVIPIPQRTGAHVFVHARNNTNSCIPTFNYHTLARLDQIP
jgi:hypothetical protein